MTYIAAWKTRANVYIVADTMLTGAAGIHGQQSSFGEKHIADTAVSVAERAMKIVTRDDLAIGLCGDFGRARGLASSIIAAYRRCREPAEALRSMIASNSPFPSKLDVSLAVAWRGEPVPRLFSFNHDGTLAIREYGEGEGFPLGSVGPVQRAFTQRLFPPLIHLEGQGPAPYLAGAIAILQSFGVHDYLVQDGVGGAFTGLFVTTEQIDWQPDTLFMLDDPIDDIVPAIATCVRAGALVVISTITNDTRVLTTTLDVLSSTALSPEKLRGFAAGHLRKGVFDFVVLLGVKQRAIVVIEMRRSRQSRLLKFNPEDETAGKTRWLSLHPDLLAALRQDFIRPPERDAINFRVVFYPFE